MSNANQFKSSIITGFLIYSLLNLLLEYFPFTMNTDTLVVRTLSVRQTPLSWELFSSKKNLTLPLDICGDLREGIGGDTTWVGLTTGEAALVGGEMKLSFSLSRKSTGLKRIMGSYNTKERDLNNTTRILRLIIIPYNLFNWSNEIPLQINGTQDNFHIHIVRN